MIDTLLKFSKTSKDVDGKGFFSYLSEITKKDRILLQDTVLRTRPNSVNYEDSWGYIIQATRYGGFKWYDPGTESLIFFGRKSETDPTLVVPNFFTSPSYLARIVRKVQNELEAPQVILKNVSPKDVVALLPYKLRPYTEAEEWSPEAPFDDQTYPQLVVDLRRLVEAKGSGYQKLRTAMNKNLNLRIEEYKPIHNSDVLEIFSLKDRMFRSSHKKMNVNYFSSHVVYPTADLDKYVVVDSGSNTIVGFTAVSNISPKVCAFVAALFTSRYRDISIWGMYQTLLNKYQQGFQFTNLGGSEFEATYRFKKEKFQPVKELEKTHLVFDHTI